MCFTGERTHIGSVPALPGSCSTPWTASCCCCCCCSSGSRSIWASTQQHTTCFELLSPPTSCQLWPTSSDACAPWTRAWNHSGWKTVSSGHLFMQIRNIFFRVVMLCLLVNSYILKNHNTCKVFITFFPLTQSNIPNHQQHHCENIKYHIKNICVIVLWISKYTILQ